MTQNCQSNPEEKEKSWMPNFRRMQTILQSYSRKNRHMEQNRNKPMHLWSKLIYNKEGKNTNIEKSLFNKWFWVNWTVSCKENSEHPLKT